jgi:hypothetical protein
MVAHIGDSNLGMTAARFQSAYDALGLTSVVDAANGRGAETVKEGTTALDVVAQIKADTPAAGRCWIVALSGADAVQTYLDGQDPRPSIKLIADAIGAEPMIWIPPVLTSAATEWNLLASTAYDIGLADVVARRSNVTILDWPTIALQHLDQFQEDGVHYKAPLYEILVDTVLTEAGTVWDIQP